ncbi:hypothetical protein ABFT23_14530 [Nocardioides sp. C4-1]|uniref:hypothetical protein n=1 Tax=Nocardioides sp. C4-1 TaxID=3151851 RepID=UPI003264FDEC
MLNDIALPTRLLVAGFGAAIGIILGGVLVEASSGAALAMLVIGLGVEVAVLVAFPVVLRRGEQQFNEVVVAATHDIASGAVTPVPALGRVVRRRAVRLPWWLPGRGGGDDEPMMTVLTAVGDGEPRRVAAVVPADLGLEGRDVPALLMVHPQHRDVAVVDDRVTPDLLAEVDGDPRWTTEALPTDRSVVGGYLPLLAAALVGAALGAAFSALVVTLAT